MRGILQVNIAENTVPGLGTPLNPNKKMKIPREDKEGFNYGYTGPIDFANKSLEDADKMDTSHVSIDLKNGFSGSFDYTDDVLRTFKFFGMDISDDFQAVIPLGNGYVVVGDLYNPVLIGKLVSEMGDDLLNSSKAILQNLDESDIRKLVTSLKTGTLYSIAKSLSDSVADVSDYGMFLSEFTKNFGEDLIGSTENVSTVLLYKSIILNLVNKKEEVVSSVKAGLNGADADAVGQQVFSVIMRSFGVLMEEYAKTRLALSALDLWSYYGKMSMGEKAFNESLEKMNAAVIQSYDTKEVLSSAVSFAGVTTNLVMVGKYSEVKSLSNSVKDFSRSLFSNDISGMKRVPMLDLVQSMISDNDFDFGVDGLSTLTLEEAQAFAVMDTLRYIDEDAEFSKETYDLSDPEQRGLYVRSAIKSYERNFKEFKPARSYDVTEKMASLVENIGVESVKFITIDKNDPDIENEDDMITMTSKEVEIRMDINSMKKAFSLLRRSLSKVSKSF